MTEEQRKKQYTKTYRDNNRTFYNYSKNRSATKSFINKADLEDIYFLKQVIKEREEYLRKLGLQENIKIITKKHETFNKDKGITIDIRCLMSVDTDFSIDVGELLKDGD